MSIRPSESGIVAAEEHRRRIQYLILFLACLVLILTAVLSMTAGAASLSVSDIVKALITPVRPRDGIAVSRTTLAIVWNIRLPRICLALISGAGLAMCGAAMQGILRNPLVSPYTLGISSAAGFGASLAIVLGAGGTGEIAGYALITVNSFLFSLLAAGIVLLLSRMRGLKGETVILSGIATMYVFSAGTTLLQYLGTNEQIAKIVFWLMGSIASANWNEVLVCFLLFGVLFPVFMRISWHLNLISCGYDIAKSLGTRPESITNLTIIVSSLMTACVVSFIGVIGFIGLVAPHIVRLLVGEDYRLLIPGSALAGAFLLVLSDTIARSVFIPLELPIGVVTSIIGVPFFVSILMHRRRGF
jgi:iron complex transport system permease protein